MLLNRFSLREGGIISYEGESWRILMIDGFDRVMASRLSDGRKDFLEVAMLGATETMAPTPATSVADLGVSLGDEKNQSSDYLGFLKGRIIRVLPPESDLTDHQKKDLASAVEEFQMAVKILQAPSKERRDLIRQMCKTFGYSTASAYSRLKIVSISGTADALLRATRNDLGKYRIKPEVQNLVREHLARFRYIETPKTIPDITELINGACRKLGYREVSVGTVKNIDRETSLKKRLKMQGRKEQVRNQFRPKVGHLPDNDFPLAILQIDHTPCQICFVDEIDRQQIGDAWLSIAIDTYSRMILGYYLSFDAPSTLSAGMALACAFLPKEQLLRDLGVPGEWPCWGFPDIVHVDNAAELNGRMMHGARRRYRFDIRDRPVGSPNFGGHVESAFRTFMFEIKSVPGTKFSNPKDRAEYDSEGRAMMTLAEFDKYFAEFLVNDYHLNTHSGDGMDRMAPIQRWRKGIFEGDVMPPTGLPDRPSDPDTLKISMMPFEMRTVRNATVDILGESYHSGALTLLGDNIDLTKPLSERKFEVRYDPRNISRVWLYNELTGTYIPLTFSDIRKSPISLWENRARKKRLGNPAEVFADERYESKIRRLDMLDDSAKKTKLQRRETEKANRRERTALVQPAPIPTQRAKPQAAKKGLDPSRLASLKNKVREALIPIEVSNKKTTNGDQ